MYKNLSLRQPSNQCYSMCLFCSESEDCINPPLLFSVVFYCCCRFLGYCTSARYNKVTECCRLSLLHLAACYWVLVTCVCLFIISVLPSWSRAELFAPCLPALVRICEAFPPLVDDVISLLMQLGRICMSEESLTAWQDWTGGDRDNEITAVDNHILCLKIQVTFANILSRAVLKVKIY